MMKNTLKNKDKSFNVTTLGFTLAELLGVIVILALLMLLVFPSIIKEVKGGRANIDEAVETLIFQSTGNFIDNHQNTYPINNDATYCITLSQLVNAGEITEGLLIDNKGKRLDLTKKVEVQIQNGQKNYQMNDECVS